MFPGLEGSDVMTDFLFVDSTHPSGLTPGTIPSGYLCFLSTLPLALYTRRTHPCSTLLAATKTKPEASCLVGSHLVSVPALIPHSLLLSGPTWWLTIRLCLLFPSLKSSLGLDHRIQLLFQLWASLSYALLVTLRTYKIFN